MADWSPLRRLLEGVDDRLAVTWSDLDRIVGGLPRSAYDHSAFWAGDRNGWPGFTAKDVRVGETVTFVRRVAGNEPSRTPSTVEARMPGEAPDRVEVVLVGCVKSKLGRPAQARDLYTSALFRKARAYAEATGVGWFVLSAEHGLVEPEQVIEPYELHLSSTSRAYRTEWGRRVVHDLQANLGDLRSKVIEVHAGKAYVDAVLEGLVEAGATVVEPLAGLTMGERLAWYAPVASGRSPVTAEAVPAEEEVAELVAHLRSADEALTPGELLAAGPDGLEAPGLYSWWVDEAGATDLSRGLGQRVDPGLIYAGLAGATRARSGRRSTNTLWGRLKGMHLGGRHEFSTFRRSLGSILTEARGADEIDEAHLTAWMHAHLRVIAVPVEDADALDGLETGVLAELDPPLNLAKMPKSAVRARLTELRRLHSRKRSGKAIGERRPPVPSENRVKE
jgi:hypothetical protein